MSQPKIKAGAVTLDAVDAITLSGASIGTGANGILQLNGSAQIPAVDGSLITDVVVPFRGASVFSTSLPFPAVPTSTPTVLEWNSEAYDTDSIHEITGSPAIKSRFVLPVGTTKIKLHACIVWPSHATGYRMIEFLRNGGAMIEGNARAIQNTVSGVVLYQTVVTPVFDVVDTDYYEVQVTQTSGGDLNPTIGSSASTFSIEIIE